MNRLLPKPREDIVVVDSEIVPRPKSGVTKLSAIAVLAILLGLVSMSFLGANFAYVGSFVLATVPAMFCGWVAHRIFKNKTVTCVVGVLTVVLMHLTGTLIPFILTLREFLTALSYMAGYVAGLILAIMIGIAWSMRRS